MRYKKGLDPEQKKALAELMKKDSKDSWYNVELCLVTARYKAYTKLNIETDKFHKYYLPSFKKLKLHHKILGKREFFDKEYKVFLTSFKLDSNLKLFKNKDTAGFDAFSAARVFKKFEEWIPYLDNSYSLKSADYYHVEEIPPSAILEAKEYSDFVKKAFPDIHRTRCNIFKPDLSSKRSSF